MGHLSGAAVQALSSSPRHSAFVRVTHWINSLSVACLIASGFAILLSHPRLYWGETGNLLTPSLIDLPLPFVLKGQNGPGRYLHFLAGWVLVLNGLVYVFLGFLKRHFRTNLIPGGADLARFSRVLARHLRFERPPQEESLTYNVVQKLAYLTVVFVLFPFVIWTGLAMSPAVTSVLPALVTVLGGQQSARTIHFFVAGLIVLFFAVHVAMVCRAGFTSRTRAMIAARGAGKERT